MVLQLLLFFNYDAGVAAVSAFDCVVSTAHLKKTADGSTADSQILGDLCFCQFVFSVERRTSAALLATDTGLPRVFPLDCACAMPALTRSLSISRSNSTNTASIPAKARPVGVVISKCFRQRDEADAQLGQFLQPQDEIGERTAPAVQPPDDDRIQFAAADGGKEAFPLGSLNCTDPISLTSTTIFHPRRRAYSRIALICSGKVCWSCVETRA